MAPPPSFMVPTPIASNKSPSRAPSISPSRPTRPTWTCIALSPLPKESLLKKIGTLDGGLAVVNNPDAQKAILKFIEAVEEENESQAPTQDTRLPGSWRMIYTSSASILGAKRPPFLRPKKLLQFIAPAADEVLNVEIIQPLGPGNISWTNKVRVNASVDGPKRVNVQFRQFELFGPLLKFNTENDKRFRGWLDVTYLDEDMRISRGSEDNVFVLVRDSETMETYS